MSRLRRWHRACGGSLSAVTSPDQAPLVDPAAENVLTAAVEYLNARDFEGLAELLDPDVDCPWFEVAGREGVVDGFNDLALRYPAMLFTRAELGIEPVIVAWGYGASPGVHVRQDGSFRRMGVLTFTFSDGEETLIDHIGYDDDPDPGAELLAEEPDPGDLPEGVDWLEWDAGEPGDGD